MVLDVKAVGRVVPWEMERLCCACSYGKDVESTEMALATALDSEATVLHGPATALGGA